MNVFCGKIWTDYRLTWNVSEFGGMTHVYLSTSDVWTPDTTLYNKLVYALESLVLLLIPLSSCRGLKYKKVSYRKQIARQHSITKFGQGRARGRPCKNLPHIYFDHRAKHGCCFSCCDVCAHVGRSKILGTLGTHTP